MWMWWVFGMMFGAGAIPPMTEQRVIGYTDGVTGSGGGRKVLLLESSGSVVQEIEGVLRAVGQQRVKSSV